MHFANALTCLAVIGSYAQALQCPNGGQIFEIGINEQGKRDVVWRHNDIRKQILNGTLSGQPKGRDILMVKFDNQLAQEGRVVTQSCQFKHIIAKDNRWGWVGQNLYEKWYSSLTPGQDWQSAVEAWFVEHNNFIYPDKSNGRETGHYTQLVWHNSEYIGCDFISYYDKDMPNFPYAKMYMCNYGPGGNIQGQAPYERA